MKMPTKASGNTPIMQSNKFNVKVIQKNNDEFKA